MKAYKTPAGEYSFILQEGTQDFRLFQNFLATTGKNLSDTSLKMLFEKMFTAYQTAEMKDAGSIVKPVEMGNANQTNQKLDIISQKVDSVIRAIGSVGKTQERPQTSIDMEAIEGAFARMEKVLSAQVGNKIESLTEGVAFNNLRACVDEVLSAILKQTTVFTRIEPQIKLIGQMGQEVLAPASATEIAAEIANIVNVVSTSAAASEPEGSMAIELPEVVIELDEVVRYPARKKKGSVPKCYGNFKDSVGENASPCCSCVWVNECSLKEPVKADKSECFGNYKPDLKCGNCSSASDCMMGG